MTRDIFDDFPDFERKDRGEPYRPGKNVADTGLAELILEHFWKDSAAIPFNFTHEGGTSLLDTMNTLRVWEVIYGGEIPEPNVLLDQLVMLMTPDCKPSYLQRAGNLFSGLIQKYYEEGHNDFVLDMSSLTALQTADYRLGLQFGTSLHGTEDEPLRLKLRGAFSQLFVKSKYLDADMVGSVIEAGEQAEYSTFTFRGTSGIIGSYAVECEFFVKRPGCVCRSGHNNLYHVKQQVDEEDIMRLRRPVDKVLQHDFWDNKNTLLNPDPDNPGWWYEVRP